MEDRIKIIYIAPEGITDKKLKNFEERHSATWAEPFSRELIKRWNKIKVEIWKTYDVSYYGHRGVSIRQKEGIKYRMFPAYNLVGTKYFSYQLLKELYAQKRKNRIIVHLQQLHCIMPYCIAFLCSDVPLVAQQRGGSQPPSTMFKFRKYIESIFSEETF